MVQSRFPNCPRCDGKVFVNIEDDGVWAECLQCGWEQELSRAELYSASEHGTLSRRLPGMGLPHSTTHLTVNHRNSNNGRFFHSQPNT